MPTGRRDNPPQKNEWGCAAKLPKTRTLFNHEETVGGLAL